MCVCVCGGGALSSAATSGCTHNFVLYGVLMHLAQTGWMDLKGQFTQNYKKNPHISPQWFLVVQVVLALSANVLGKFLGFGLLIGHFIY